MIKLIIERKTLLNEVKLEDVKQRFQSKKFKKAFAAKAENASKRLLDQVPSDIEEKYKGALLNWLISWAIKNRTVGIPGDFKSSAEIFFQIKEQNLQRLLSKKSIAQISSPEELISVVAQAKPKYDKHIADKIENSRKGEGQNLIYQTDKWEVYIPETKGAACALGKDTQWCTAAPGLNYYKSYHSKEYPLIIFISKQDPNEKYQFQYKKEQFMDRNDKGINKKPLFFKLNEIVKSLSDKLPKETIEKADQYSFEELPNGEYMTSMPDAKRYYNSKEELHREDGPAVIKTNGVKLWFLNGERHREDGPSYENPNGHEEWYRHGEPHREDGPAVTHPNGDKFWYRNGKLHREDGPAEEDIRGYKAWFLNGIRHREDGPAVENFGRNFWFLNGIRLTQSEWEAEVSKLKSNEASTLKEYFQRYL